MTALAEALGRPPQPEFGCLPRRATPCTPRELFLALFVDLEEKVEYMEPAFHFAAACLRAADAARLPDAACASDDALIEALRTRAAGYRAPSLDAAVDAAWAVRVVQAYAPTGLSDGAWLRGMMLANAIETEASMPLLRQLMTRFGGPGVQEGYAPRYAELLRSVGLSPRAALRPGPRACAGAAYEHALLGVCLGVFPTTLRAEIIGFNAFVSAAGPCPLLARLAPALARLDASLRYFALHDGDEMTRLSERAVRALLAESQSEAARRLTRRDVARGFVAAEQSYARWLTHVLALAGDAERALVCMPEGALPLVGAYAPPQLREPLEDFAIQRYGALDNASLYHAFVNVDLHPAARVMAKAYAGAVFAKIDEVFAEDPRLNSRHAPPYSERAIAEILAGDHVKNVRSRETPNHSLVSGDNDEAVKGIQEVFDGCWLQGFADVQRAEFEEYGWLFRIYASEHGDGDFAWNHCQIFRKAFLQLGEDVMLPKTDRRLYDLFDIGFAAMVTLAVSLNTRHFMPEILGINLSMESTGVGGSYLTRWKRAEQEGNPWRALAWRLHNSIDNYADGHARWSLSAIQAFMKRVKDGAPEAVDAQWRRIWRLWRARDILVHGTLDEQSALDGYFTPEAAQPADAAPA